MRRLDNLLLLTSERLYSKLGYRMNEKQGVLCLAFEAMNRKAQMEVLQKEGVYIGKRKHGSGTSLLYQYQSIYIEVVYSVHRLHVEEVYCHVDTSILDRYSPPDFF